MMNLEKDSYIILELIPTHTNPEKGIIIQLSALKLKGLQLLDRFDYRVKDELIENEDLKQMIQYDKKSFTYVDNPYFILEKLKSWAGEIPILLIENSYTSAYLKELENKKELVYPYLDMEHNHNVFNQLTKKYNLEPSEHLVDLIYEAIIHESNNKQ